jgi:hypothetical protein
MYAGTLSASDSLATVSLATVSLATVSRHLPSTLFWSEVYSQPAAMLWQPYTGKGSVEASYARSGQESYHLLGDGEGGQAFGLEAKGAAKRTQVMLWGNASYSYRQRERVQWSSVSDGFRMGPYQLADSIGGRMYGERYRLSGGLSAMLGRWTWAAEAAYTAGNDYRRNDPRPKTITSDLLAKAGGSRPLGHYQAGITVSGGVYQQDLDINVMGNINNKAQIFAMRGFGLYDLLHSSYTSSFRWQYSGVSYGAAAFLLPRNRSGWTLHGAAGRESMESLAEPATPNSRYPFMLSTLTANVLAGYSVRSSAAASELKLRCATQESAGSERLYKLMQPEGATLTEYHLLSESDKYARTLRQLALSGLHERHSARRSKWLQLEASVESYAERYAYPSYAARYVHAGVQAAAGAEQRWEKALLAVEVALGCRYLAAKEEKVPYGSYIFARSMQPDLEVMASSPLNGGAKVAYEHDFIGSTRWFVSLRATGLWYRGSHAAWGTAVVGAVF